MITWDREAIAGLRYGWPEIEFEIRGTEITVLTDHTLPSETDIRAKGVEAINIIELRKLRGERDILLAESDWVVIKHTEAGTTIPAAWSTYRQALRDITSTYSNVDEVVWPEKPSG